MCTYQLGPKGSELEACFELEPALGRLAPFGFRRIRCLNVPIVLVSIVIVPINLVPVVLVPFLLTFAMVMSAVSQSVIYEILSAASVLRVSRALLPLP